MGYQNRILVDGKTLNQIAKESGVRLATVQHRYSRGATTYEELTKLPPHEANIKKVRNRRRDPLYIVGSGERLMEEILKKDIRITDISRETGISRSTIYSFVYNNTDISSAKLAKICAYIGMSTDYVLGIGKCG